MPPSAHLTHNYHGENSHWTTMSKPIIQKVVYSKYLMNKKSNRSKIFAICCINILVQCKNVYSRVIVYISRVPRYEWVDIIDFSLQLLVSSICTYQIFVQNLLFFFLYGIISIKCTKVLNFSFFSFGPLLASFYFQCSDIYMDESNSRRKTWVNINI